MHSHEYFELTFSGRRSGITYYDRAEAIGTARLLGAGVIKRTITPGAGAAELIVLAAA